MSRISDIEQARHFVVTDEEVRKRFHSVIHDFGLPIQNGLDMKNMTRHRLPPQVFINSDFHGNTYQNTFGTSVFFESNFSGNTIDNGFQDADFLGGSIDGRFLRNKTQGMYLRYVDISRAIFNDFPAARRIQLPDNEVTVHQTTGRIVFCSGVERSIVEPEDVATFRPLNIRLSDGSIIPFLARLYYDGEHRKLGLITKSDILFETLDAKSRLWPNFIYTLTNDSKPLRDQIEADFIRELPKIQAGNPRILPQVEYAGLGKITLRPARPIDTTFLHENASKISSEISKHLPISTSLLRLT